MKTRNTLLPARFEPPTRFDVRPNLRGLADARFEALKLDLLRTQLNSGGGADTRILLRRAANEAAALAWMTQYPLLFFPALFEEKAGQARRQALKQAQVRERSRNLMVEAA